MTIVLLLAAWVSLLLLGSLPADAGVNCDDTITRSTTLQQDLVCEDAPALTVRGPATLDLGGHMVRCIGEPPGGGTFQSCVSLTGERARLRSGMVIGFSGSLAHAIVLGGNGGHTMRGVFARNEGGTVVVITSDENRLLFNNVLGDGAFEVRGDRNLLRSNQGIGVSDNFIVRGADNRLIGNTVPRGEGGIGVSGPNNLLRGNEIFVDNGMDAIISLGPGGHSTRVISNILRGGSPLSNDDGIFVRSDRNVIRANEVHNFENGILVYEGAEFNRILGNDARDNELLDLVDLNEDCDNNVWLRNRAGTVNQMCIDAALLVVGQLPVSPD